MKRRTTPRKHGTRARYVFGPFGSDRAEGCRCTPCRQANNAYGRFSQKRVRLNRDHGTWARPYVDTVRARAHIEHVRAQGIGYRHVAQLAGVATSQIGDIISGRSKRIRRETESAILAVHPQPAPGALIDAAETWILIGELLAAGVTKKRIGQVVSGNPKALALQLRKDRITVRAARRVADLHHELLATPPAPYACTCGLALHNLDEWRAHNGSLRGGYASHRLVVTQQEATG